MAGSRGKRSGTVVTVFAAKGGCGKTTFATNLAIALHANGARRTCLVDLDLNFGDLAATLTLQPHRALADSLPLSQRAVWSHTSIATYRPGLDCVLAPVRPGAAERIPATQVRALLTLLPTLYEYVVIDTPAQLSTHVLAAFDYSHHHVLLTTPERPALKNLRNTLDMLDLLAFGQTSRSIVVNRANGHAGITAEDIDGVVRNPIAAYLPSTWELSASVNRGVPLAESAPGHPFSLAVRRFADTRIRGGEVVAVNQETGREPPPG
ncbi:Type II/IV secretion system ATPase TadZ/CpaE, associated with Flp pilus assembly [Alloactinosynnema sp. L-07]|uniref:AAA family ATPase n=1 Tax=Alloactinosynnema sp. L-07 TaxID=1653480 RepID=UPI00065EF591|nr:P-loop NTPase [Alloactinosynnema sp. L-07]CRK55002.1 Type II/IV secretion system ATPase TadZ/CpaE, associated with Flp pilus assembly [Alloactinosynnema sp. L-07]